MESKWKQTDELCPTCGHVTKRVRGLTKQNLKKLVSFKWDWDEFIMTLVLILLVITAFAYKHDIAQCKAYVKDITENPCKFCRVTSNIGNPLGSNVTLDSVKEAYEKRNSSPI